MDNWRRLLILLRRKTMINDLIIIWGWGNDSDEETTNMKAIKRENAIDVGINLMICMKSRASCG